MDVNSVIGSSATKYETAVTNENGKKAATDQGNEKKQTQTNEANETNVLGYVYEATKDDKKTNEYKPDMEKVKKMIEESNKKVDEFRTMLENLINRQAKKSENASNIPSITTGTDNKPGNESEALVEIDEETRLKAQQEISEDGYYGVKQTSERLLEFAKAISGGDPSKIGLLRDAVDQGFEAAAKKFGKELPEISQKTYEAVMKGFDEWEKSATADYVKDNVTSQIANSILGK